MVIRITAWGQLSPSITLGNQKWKGAAPALSKSEINKKILAEPKDKRKKEADKIITEDPKAWIRKYLRADSEEYWLFLDEIRGINDNKFNSRPTQAPNQEDEEIDNTVPINKVDKNKNCGEDNIIKKRETWSS